MPARSSNSCCSDTLRTSFFAQDIYRTLMFSEPPTSYRTKAVKHLSARALVASRPISLGPVYLSLYFSMTLQPLQHSFRAPAYPLSPALNLESSFMHPRHRFVPQPASPSPCPLPLLVASLALSSVIFLGHLTSSRLGEIQSQPSFTYAYTSNRRWPYSASWDHKVLPNVTAQSDTSIGDRCALVGSVDMKLGGPRIDCLLLEIMLTSF